MQGDNDATTEELVELPVGKAPAITTHYSASYQILIMKS